MLERYFVELVELVVGTFVEVLVLVGVILQAPLAQPKGHL